MMNTGPGYHIDRTLSNAELTELANNFAKIPEENKETLKMRFTGAQHGYFYAGFNVAALDVFHHLRCGDSEESRLPQVQYVAALILKKAGHLFRHLELPFSPDLLKMLYELPPSACTTIQNLLMDCPCEPHEYQKLELIFPISDEAEAGRYIHLDKPPLFYAGLFHGYYKLYAFLAEDSDATNEDNAAYAMSIAMFLAEKIVSSSENATNSEDQSRETGSS